MDPTKSSKEAMDEFFEKIKKDPEVMLAVRGLYEIQQVRQWQKSIRSLLISNDTQFIADEVDDIFSVTKEYNYALGDPEITHEDIRACVHDSMQKIFTSDKMATFRSLLLGNKQPLLKELDGDGNQKIVSELKKLASEMFKEIAPFGLSEENWRLIKEGFNGDEGAFIRYVMGEPGNGIPNLSKVPTDLHKHISILQTLFSSKLKAVFVKDAGYDCDVDIIDGCTVVPRKEGKPLPGMRFSDEYELVAMQYLFHLVKGPSREYFKGIWLELQYLAPMPKVVEDWYNKANVKGLKANEEFEKLYEHLQNNEASWEMKLFILQNDILKNRVKISREQSKCGSQDPLTGANVAGASGTINPYAMPEGFTEDESVNSRKVMGTILTKLAEMLPKQLDTPVGIFGDAKAWLIEKAKDSQCQFIINQEGVGGGTYIFDFIKTNFSLYYDNSYQFYIFNNDVLTSATYEVGVLQNIYCEITKENLGPILKRLIENNIRNSKLPLDAIYISSDKELELDEEIIKKYKIINNTNVPSPIYIKSPYLSPTRLTNHCKAAPK
ncbi:MAG: hypothetical protein ACK4HV_05660, partial [Parachlamydiaceae bacterium]